MLPPVSKVRQSRLPKSTEKIQVATLVDEAFGRGRATVQSFDKDHIVDNN